MVLTVIRPLPSKVSASGDKACGVCLHICRTMDVTPRLAYGQLDFTDEITLLTSTGILVSTYTAASFEDYAIFT